ncbi:MAG: FAD-dependent oxidoreductase, partial [Pseudomonadota bacterium]
YPVLRAVFDHWLAAKAEDAGAVLAGSVRVDDLIWNNGRVAGVVAGPDEMAADVVVAADGVNSLLAQKAGLKKELKPGQVSVGVKEVIALPQETINDRFGLKGDEGAARLFVGEATKGRIGGGFIYTNRASLSLGLVFNLENLIGSERKIPDLLEEFKGHPLIEPLLEGGRSVEYAAHLVPEAGLNMLPRLYTDGFLVVGDAAGLVINLGYLIRGMDLAIASGQAAAQTIIQAHQEKDFSQKSLARYQQALEDSFVLKDLRTYRSAQAFLDNPRLYSDYPQLVEAVLADMFTVDGRPARPLLKKVWPHLRRFGLTRLLKDSWKGRRAL